MGGAHDIALQFPFQDMCIAPLHTSRHGLSNEWKRLMPITSAQLDHCSIQLESMISEARLAKSYAAVVFFDDDFDNHLTNWGIGPSDTPRYPDGIKSRHLPRHQQQWQYV